MQREGPTPAEKHVGSLQDICQERTSVVTRKNQHISQESGVRASPPLPEMPSQGPMVAKEVVNLYPLENYTFGVKDAKMEKDSSVPERMARLRHNYMKEGMRTSVEGVMLVHHRNHPHVLLLQVGFSFFKLPGGRLRPGEDEAEGMKRKLGNKLGPPPEMGLAEPAWQVGDCSGMWWRPNFEQYLYPYCPAHITKPKECKKVFLIPLPEREHFCVPRNLRIIAVPLFELYDNTAVRHPSST